MAGKHGGARSNAGRKRGGVNQDTAEIRAIAQQHGPKAVAALAKIAFNAKEGATARIAAIKELLDRGYGKSLQPITAELEHGVTSELKEILARQDGTSWGLPGGADTGT